MKGRKATNPPIYINLRTSLQDYNFLSFKYHRVARSQLNPDLRSSKKIISLKSQIVTNLFQRQITRLIIENLT